MSDSRMRVSGLIAACAIVLSGCLPSISRPPPPVTIPQRLFVANFASGGATSNVSAYVFPLSAASGPGSVLTSLRGVSGPSGLAFDGTGDLFVANASNNTVTAYFPFLGAGSNPAVTLSNGLQTPQDVTLDRSADLYVANFTGGASGGVAVFVPRFLNTSAPLFTIVNGINGPTGVAFDGSKLWVANKTGANVASYSLPASAASAPVITLTSGLTGPVAVTPDGLGDLYVVDNTANAIAVFKPVISSASSPSFTIVNGVNAPRYATFDAGGNLYVSNASNVAVYLAPLSSASSPAFTITTGVSTPVGLAVGF